MRHQNKWGDRRSASGSLKPFIFLIVEIVALCMICWFVSRFGILFMTVLASIAGIYYFMSSALPRYKNVIERQKYSGHD